MNLHRPSSTEHHHLATRRSLTQYGANILLKSHVKHPICLIQDHKGSLTQIAYTHLNQILQTSRSSNDDINTRLQGRYLRSFIGSPIEAKRFHATRFPSIAKDICNLLCKLPSG
uniref:Uncharacterized protein n=1 Tax=Opuntia streptacantha TaxID=393608 RepID=A0A7C9EZA4_OPUST